MRWLRPSGTAGKHAGDMHSVSVTIVGQGVFYGGV